MDWAQKRAYYLLDKGLIPDFVQRIAVRALCKERIHSFPRGSLENIHASKMKWIEDARSRPSIAEHTDKANQQHYEVPTDFILSTLGPRAKYSACLFPTGRETLAQAEEAMLSLYCERAQLDDGMSILDLGCGWGSLCLYLAEKYPKSYITALSNSSTQKDYIDRKAKEKGLNNITVITADINLFTFGDSTRFDRILSIEMFEHMRNYELLLKKISRWLKPSDEAHGGQSFLFVHIFCHKTTPYYFEEDDGWMSKHFFTGGTMPSHDLFLYLQSDVTLVRSWFVSGKHYGRTCEHWLRTQDQHAKEGLKALLNDAEAKGIPASEARAQFNRRGIASHRSKWY